MPNSINFAPDSFFFTDPAALTQAAGQSYGPVSADEFRLTSKFSLSAATQAYAVCTSVILVQPQAGSSTKVNLILRPFNQPVIGLNIKYFVYRGLNKSDFFSGNNVLTATGSTSDFINNINAAFAAFYHNTDVPAFLAKYIGFDPANQADELPLSDLFFKQSEYSGDVETPQTAFDLPVIQAGSSLGNFAAGECGFEVVLNYGDYSLPEPSDEFIFDLAYARAAEAKINISGVTGDFAKKKKKEQVFQFLDAAAYYGFHYRENGVVRLNNSGTKVKKTGEAIYTDVIQNFYTKNNLYLYIQSDRTRSYNFYGNYFIEEGESESLMIGITEESLVIADYGTSGWPLLIDHTTQTHSNARNTLFLQFVTDNNDNTMLYGQVGDIDNAEGNNFCGPDDLRLADDEDGNPSIYTKVIQLSNAASGSGGAKVNVANFNILIYQGQTYDYIAGQTTDENGDPVDIIAEPNFFDDVFDNLNAEALLKAGESSYSTVASQKVKLINHYYYKTQFGVSAVQTAIINDHVELDDTNSTSFARVIYITETINLLNDITSVAGTVTSDTKSFPSIAGLITDNPTYSLPEPFYYKTINFTDDGVKVAGVELLTTDNSTPSKVILGIAKGDNDNLLNLININSITNVGLFLVPLFLPNEHLVSAENILYEKYRLGLVGETIFGELKLFVPDIEIVVYSLDRRYYFSNQFGDFIPDPEINNEYYIVNTVIS